MPPLASVALLGALLPGALLCEISELFELESVAVGGGAPAESFGAGVCAKATPVTRRAAPKVIDDIDFIMCSCCLQYSVEVIQSCVQAARIEHTQAPCLSTPIWVSATQKILRSVRVVAVPSLGLEA